MFWFYKKCIICSNENNLENEDTSNKSWIKIAHKLLVLVLCESIDKHLPYIPL